MRRIIQAFISILLSLGMLSNIYAAQVEVHDPVMARENGIYYVFSTGPGITMYSSTDKVHWKYADRVFSTEPTWARSVAPEFNGHLWAPEIYEKNGKFYLYYSVSAFGKNTSAIGVTVNQTLNPDSPDYHWQDQGIVIQSVPDRDNWNAIDPAIVEDDNGNIWMSFGSFWSGLKLVKLNPDMKSLAQPQAWFDIASRPGVTDNPVEAPFIFKKDGYYYLFVSFDFCCRGVNSTYKVMVGRSQSVQGPYYDKNGVSMLNGGGSLVLEGNQDWAALGHNSIYTFDHQDYIVLHAYETADNGVQKLRILKVNWENGWPVVNPDELNTNTTELVE
ncbi:Extracellular exo-alpha-(1-_5)-L-arabinofuranosidase ArbA precursor [Vibrio ruber DSM 16370]|uniref:Extracellular exo-alpha-(1->5)-L-arabinofuranosidase n=1 Tax=Vibrio ruber (strain DSM 16370 / JCM 11486 / BCRC 17186 / CECT 7878 / LMG 23124 / VR1) TaxID=1123498 RepID=A0A1R4L9I7_VIBR1|nr:arabinan endo-1,5-alpha-L-arabinosidase [Vibrio ruber]SJN52924.1 Extracellular exo-alpha-(1->5)-L-arabinofuranosidase ArbA precursor [Vibrio ruber DSM 16370]